MPNLPMPNHLVNANRQYLATEPGAILLMTLIPHPVLPLMPAMMAPGMGAPPPP